MNRNHKQSATSRRRPGRRRMPAALASFLVLASILAIGAASASAAPPTVVTEAPTSPFAKKVNFYGSVNPNGLPTNLYFQYGTTTAYGSSAPGYEIYAGEGSTVGKWWALDVPVLEDTIYHVRIVASNKDGVSFGEDKVVKSLEPVPTWKLQTTPAGNSAMNDVSCVAGGECFAVGDTGVASPSKLAMRWNGTEWKNQTTAPEVPGPTSLASISCTSTTACVAVGYLTSGGTYLHAEKWNGTEWKRLELGLGGKFGKFTGVSCVTATYCVAVSSSGARMSWDGTTWTTMGGESTLNGTDVSCPTTTFCMAVGAPLVAGKSTATWNGSFWTLQSGPAGYTLEGVSCSAKNVCTAVGYDASQLPVAARWDGTKWTTQSIPLPAGGKLALLYGVSCPGATVCFATGTYLDASSVVQTLTERWDGISWSAQASPNPVGGTENKLFDVSCISRAICESVGSSKVSGKTVAVAERAS